MKIRLSCLLLAYLLTHLCSAIDESAGMVSMANNPISRVIDGRTGEPVAGGLFVAGLYYSTNLDAVPDPSAASDDFQLAGTSFIDPPSMDLNGIWFGKLIELPGTRPGQVVLIQIRVWSLPYESYEEAFRGPDTLIGASSLLNPVELGGGFIPPPSTFIQGGLTSFVIYPNGFIPSAPIAQSIRFNTNKNKPLAGQLFGNDPQGRPLTFIQTSEPTKGTLDFRPVGSFFYTPFPDVYGTERFFYKVSNGEQESQTATVTIEIWNINNLPDPIIVVTPHSITDSNDDSWLGISPNNTNATVMLDGSLSSDPDGDPLQFAWVDGTAIIPFSTYTITTVTLDLGTQLISLFVDDGEGLTRAEAVIEIISSDQAVGGLISHVDAANLRKGKRKALKSTLLKAEDFLARNKFAKGAHQLEVFLKKIHTKIDKTDPALANQLRLMTEEILAALNRDISVNSIQ